MLVLYLHGQHTVTIIWNDKLGNETKVTYTAETIRYVWHRYSAKENKKYKLGEWVLINTTGTDSMPANGTVNFGSFTVYTGYTLDTSTGKITGTGAINRAGSQNVMSRTLYSLKGKGLWKYTGSGSGTKCRVYTYEAGVEVASSSWVCDYSSTQSTCTSCDRNCYPDGGRQGSYWYNYLGTE